MKSDSPVIALLRHVWQNTARPSWMTLNHVLADALSIAILAEFKFEADDFKTMALPPRDGGFDSHRWLSGGERFYAMACGRDRGTANLSAVISFETWRERKPFLIAQADRKSRLRIAEGVEFAWTAGERWRVTSFAADQSHFNAVKNSSVGGPTAAHRIRISHADVKAFNAGLKSEEGANG